MAYSERHGSREGSILIVLMNGNTANDLTCDPVESSSHLCTATPENSLSSCSLKIISGSRPHLSMSCPMGPRGVVSACLGERGG